VRSGHADAEALSRHGRDKEPATFRKVVSNILWAMPPTWPLWPVLCWRIYRHRGDPAYAAFTVLGKLPHFEGQMKYWIEKRRGTKPKIIEYK
jgi:hypothetical protein